MIRSRRLTCWPVLLLAQTLFATAAEQRASDLEFAARDAESRFMQLLSTAGDGAASRYLDGVLARLLAAAPEPAFADCRVYLIRGSKPSVFALPNCRLYVSTALFVLLENEAQLAALLARELAHVRYRHALAESEDVARKVDSLHTLAFVLGAAFGTSGGGYGVRQSTEATSDLIWRVSIRGYSPEREKVADGVALRRLTAAGFQPADAIRAFSLLRSCASPQSGVAAPRITSLEYVDQRIANLRLVADSLDGGAAASSDHSAIAAGLRLELVEVLIAARDFPAARRWLDEHVASRGHNGHSHYLTGEIARLEERGSRAAALEAYDRAAAFADAPAAMYLTMGLMLREDQQHERARLALARFLELEPAAAEAAFIRLYLEQPPVPQP